MSPCSETSCRHPATHAIKLCVPATGWPQDEARALSMLLGAPFCRRHAEAFKVEQLLDAPNEKGATLRDTLIPAMVRLKGSRIPPDCDRAWIVPLRLESRAYREAHAAMTRRGQGPIG